MIHGLVWLVWLTERLSIIDLEPIISIVDYYQNQAFDWSTIAVKNRENSFHRALRV